MKESWRMNVNFLKTHSTLGHSDSVFVMCSLLGYSPGSEFYVPTFRNNLFHLYRRPTKMEQIVQKLLIMKPN